MEDRKFRPFVQKFRPTGKSAKSFFGFLSRGVPKLLPGSSPKNFRWSVSSGPGNFPVEFWLSHFGFSSREGSRRFWAEFLPGDFRPTGSSGLQAGSSGPRPEVPVLNTGNSGPALFQRPDLLEEYKYPSTYLGTASSCNSLSSITSKSSNRRDLSIPPPKLVDFWRIEGEGPDLHLHQAVFHFPLIHLRDFVSRVSIVLP